MRVKIGDTWHEEGDAPIMIQLNSDDRVAIVGMAGNIAKFAVVPNRQDMSPGDLDVFVEGSAAVVRRLA